MHNLRRLRFAQILASVVEDFANVLFEKSESRLQCGMQTCRVIEGLVHVRPDVFHLFRQVVGQGLLVSDLRQELRAGLLDLLEVLLEPLRRLPTNRLQLLEPVHQRAIPHLQRGAHAEGIGRALSQVVKIGLHALVRRLLLRRALSHLLDVGLHRGQFLRLICGRRRQPLLHVLEAGRELRALGDVRFNLTREPEVRQFLRVPGLHRLLELRGHVGDPLRQLGHILPASAAPRRRRRGHRLAAAGGRRGAVAVEALGHVRRQLCVGSVHGS
mmetsp:Transcript_13197/g.36203  ORF Transcript_13197/g.36203 Transcript_13197/m.36203 type:complete len:271 (-) Transcript_13197:141-953(-)